MNITVCIKQVPSIDALGINPTDFTLIRPDTDQILNPMDESALEAAFSINDALPGQITVLSMGRLSAESILRDALNLGADRAVLISDKKYAGSDTCATATILSQAIKHLGKSDLAVFGSRSADGETGQVGPEVSAALGIPCLTNVVSIIEADESFLKIKKQTNSGYDIIKVLLPAVICMNESVLRLRPPGIQSMKDAKSKKVETLDNNALRIDESIVGLKSSPTTVKRVYAYEPIFEKKCKVMDYDGIKARDNLIAIMEEKIIRSKI